MKKYLDRFLKDERGGEMAEVGINYLLVGAVVVVIGLLIGAIVTLVRGSQDQILKSVSDAQSAAYGEVGAPTGESEDGSGDGIPMPPSGE